MHNRPEVSQLLVYVGDLALDKKVVSQQPRDDWIHISISQHSGVGNGILEVEIIF